MVRPRGTTGMNVCICHEPILNGVTCNASSSYCGKQSNSLILFSERVELVLHDVLCNVLSNEALERVDVARGAHLGR